MYEQALNLGCDIELEEVLEISVELSNPELQPSVEKAKEIQKRVNEELGFTVNIGLSSNKLLAKMASDFEKPDKVHTLYTYEIESKLYPLPIEDLFGVGKSTGLKLKELGIYTIGALARTDEDFLYKYSI